MTSLSRWFFKGILIALLVANASGQTKYKLLYFNGVLTTPDQAQADLATFCAQLRQTVGQNNVSCEDASFFPPREWVVELAYNRTAGFPKDFLESAKSYCGQSYIQEVSRALNAPSMLTVTCSISWLNEVLPKIGLEYYQSDLTQHVDRAKQDFSNTQVVILLGHSQGNFFANATYDALASDKVRVIAVATPASSVRGGGPSRKLRGDIIRILPLDLDTPLTANNAPRCWANNDPFPSNPFAELNPIACHGFAGSYLAGDVTGPDIINDVLSATLPPFTFGTPTLSLVRNGNVWLMNTSGGNPRQLTTVGTVQSVRLSNGTVVFRSLNQLWRTGTIIGATPTPIPNTFNVLEFDLNPSGTRIVFTKNFFGETNTALYSIAVDGTNLRTLHANVMHQLYPSWGRDGYIYFGQSTGGDPSSQRLYRIAEAGGTPVQLTTAFSQYPAPGGPNDRVAFLTNLDLASRTIRLMNANGSGQMSIPSAPTGVQSPLSYDYDTETVYYQLSDQLWKINMSTGIKTQLATGVGLGVGVDYGKIP